MRYEHLVAVNDLSNPDLLVLNRQQLWQGLMLRAESPQTFNPHIENVILLERGEQWLLREVDFGNLLVRDRIELIHEQAIHFHTEAGDKHAGGELLISIEEPELHSLFVRFSYHTPDPQDPQEQELIAYLQEMWRQVDVECIRTLRTMAGEGHFTDPLH